MSAMPLHWAVPPPPHWPTMESQESPPAALPCQLLPCRQIAAAHRVKTKSAPNPPGELVLMPFAAPDSGQAKRHKAAHRRRSRSCVVPFGLCEGRSWCLLGLEHLRLALCARRPVLRANVRKSAGFVSLLRWNILQCVTDRLEPTLTSGVGGSSVRSVRSRAAQGATAPAWPLARTACDPPQNCRTGCCPTDWCSDSCPRSPRG